MGNRRNTEHFASTSASDSSATSHSGTPAHWSSNHIARTDWHGSCADNPGANDNPPDQSYYNQPAARGDPGTESDCYSTWVAPPSTACAHRTAQSSKSEAR